jgi:hypothetical protein
MAANGGVFPKMAPKPAPSNVPQICALPASQSDGDSSDGVRKLPPVGNLLAPLESSEKVTTELKAANIRNGRTLSFEGETTCLERFSFMKSLTYPMTLQPST